MERKLEKNKKEIEMLRARDLGDLALHPIPPEDWVYSARKGPHNLTLLLERILELSPNNSRSVGLQGFWARSPSPSPVCTKKYGGISSVS